LAIPPSSSATLVAPNMVSMNHPRAADEAEGAKAEVDARADAV
jgi:hypothetical protein